MAVDSFKSTKLGIMATPATTGAALAMNPATAGNPAPATNAGTATGGPTQLGGTQALAPANYKEYYTLRRDLDPPLDSVMDAFKSADRNDPTVAIKTHDELNTELLQTCDSSHHGYVLLAKTNGRLIVAHRLSQYQPGLGMPGEGWHQRFFAFTGDVFENQMPQTIIGATRALETMRTTKVAKLTDQVAALMNDNVLTLPPMGTAATAGTYDEIVTRYSMYVPGKYLPLLLSRRMSPKEALLSINAEAVTQNEQDLLRPLIDWLRVAVTRSSVDDTAFSVVAQTYPPNIPLADAEFSSKQKTMAERDLPGWNPTNVASQQAGKPAVDPQVQIPRYQETPPKQSSFSHCNYCCSSPSHKELFRPHNELRS
jgi:hypothetical protein